MNLNKYIKEFANTFELNIDKITDEQYFKLCFIAEDKRSGMHVVIDLDDYRQYTLMDLISWYNDHINEDYAFYDPDWAEELKMTIKEVFI